MGNVMLEFLDGFSLVCILMYQSPRLCAASDFEFGIEVNEL